ncbi:MAG: aminoacyl-tRNA hydrolase [Acidobacteria bacterium]|jgi:peptidyl-tRNA hydrolase, PTH1 family|nr:aminoacyl-tRNA hydrolase [Acidobacteriota bacterium]
MKLVVGLGNPGSRYQGTRHNVGFEVIDRLVARHRLALEAWKTVAATADWRRPDGRVRLVKPLTFMNLSGGAVAELAGFYKVDLADVFIVCDDVNLPVGRLRARAGGSDGGNNGLRSVTASFGTDEYARLRIGVGRGDEDRDLADHVLSRFLSEELPGVESAIDRAADAVETWVEDGVARVMNTFNRPE